MYEVIIPPIIWFNFVDYHTVPDNLIESMAQLEIGLTNAGIINRHGGHQIFVQLFVSFESKERAVEFLLKWS